MGERFTAEDAEIAEGEVRTFETRRGNVVLALSRFAVPEYQQRVWIRAEGPKCDSFVEASCLLYDDEDFLAFIETNVARLTSAQIAALRAFDAAFNRIPDRLEDDHDALLMHPAWPDVVRTAQLATEALEEKESR